MSWDQCMCGFSRLNSIVDNPNILVLIQKIIKCVSVFYFCLCHETHGAEEHGDGEFTNRVFNKTNRRQGSQAGKTFKDQQTLTEWTGAFKDSVTRELKGVAHRTSSAASRSATSRTTRGIAHQTRTIYTNKLPEVCCNGCVLVNSVGCNRRQWM